MTITGQIHASCVAKDGMAVLLCGPSGSGKSDLALRLIDRGAVLVADDRTDLSLRGGQVHASCPAPIAGKMEIRGLGLVVLPTIETAPVALLINLVPRMDVPRMPPEDYVSLLDRKIPQRSLHAFDHSTPHKIHLALQLCHHGQIDSGDATVMLTP